MTILRQIGEALGIILKQLAKKDLSNVTTQTLQQRLPGAFGSSTFIIQDDTGLSSLNARPGDVAITLDTNIVYRLQSGGDPTMLADWEDIGEIGQTNLPAFVSVSYAFEEQLTVSVAVPSVFVNGGYSVFDIVITDEDNTRHYAPWNVMSDGNGGLTVVIEFTESVTGTLKLGLVQTNTTV